MPVIGNLGLIQHISIVGVTFTDLANLIILHAFGDASGKESTFYKNDGTLYATSGGGFRVWAAWASPQITTAQTNNLFRLAHCAAGAGGINQASTTFTKTYMGGDSNMALVAAGNLMSSGHGVSGQPLNWLVPASKNIVMVATAQCTAYIAGYAE